MGNDGSSSELFNIRGQQFTRFAAKLIFFILFLLANPVAAYTEAKLTLGVLPAESPITLFKRMAPLRDYLSTALNKKINLQTAKDFNQYIKRTAERQYDVVFTAPHLALLAAGEGAKYDVIASFIRPLQAFFIVRDGSPINDLMSLKGKKIATPPVEAIVTMVGKQMLSEAGVDQSSGAALIPYRTHSAAFHAVRGGEVDAAIVANLIYRKNIKQKMTVKLIGKSHKFPGLGVMVARDIPEDLRLHIQLVLTSMRDSTAGLIVLKKITQPGYGVASISDFEVLRPYVSAITQ